MYNQATEQAGQPGRMHGLAGDVRSKVRRYTHVVLKGPDTLDSWKHFASLMRSAREKGT